MKMNIMIGLIFGSIVLQIAAMCGYFTGGERVSQTYSHIITPQQGHDISVNVGAMNIKPELIGKPVKVTLTLEEDK